MSVCASDYKYTGEPVYGEMHRKNPWTGVHGIWIGTGRRGGTSMRTFGFGRRNFSRNKAPCSRRVPYCHSLCCFTTRKMQGSSTAKAVCVVIFLLFLCMCFNVAASLSIDACVLVQAFHLKATACTVSHSTLQLFPLQMTWLWAICQPWHAVIVPRLALSVILSPVCIARYGDRLLSCGGGGLW